MSLNPRESVTMEAEDQRRKHAEIKIPAPLQTYCSPGKLFNVSEKLPDSQRDNLNHLEIGIIGIILDVNI